MGSQRLIWIDALKGIGILLVMLSHYSDMGSISKYLFSSYMPLFFIVSGYTAKQENFKSCFIKKVRDY